MADVELEVAEEARVAQNRAGALLQNGVGAAGLHREQEHVDPERLQVNVVFNFQHNFCLKFDCRP